MSKQPHKASTYRRRRAENRTGPYRSIIRWRHSFTFCILSRRWLFSCAASEKTWFKETDIGIISHDAHTNIYKIIFPFIVNTEVRWFVFLCNYGDKIKKIQIIYIECMMLIVGNSLQSKPGSSVNKRAW